MNRKTSVLLMVLALGVTSACGKADTAEDGTTSVTVSTKTESATEVPNVMGNTLIIDDNEVPLAASVAFEESSEVDYNKLVQAYEDFFRKRNEDCLITTTIVDENIEPAVFVTGISGQTGVFDMNPFNVKVYETAEKTYFFSYNDNSWYSVNTQDVVDNKLSCNDFAKSVTSDYLAFLPQTLPEDAEYTGIAAIEGVDYYEVSDGSVCFYFDINDMSLKKIIADSCEEGSNCSIYVDVDREDFEISGELMNAHLATCDEYCEYLSKAYDKRNQETLVD